MRFQIERIFYGVCVFTVMMGCPAIAQSVPAQAAYRCELGKKFLVSKEYLKAGEEFIAALYLDPSSHTPLDQLKALSNRDQSGSSKLSLERQYFVELIEYLRFLDDRLTVLIAENNIFWENLLAAAAQTSTSFPERSDLDAQIKRLALKDKYVLTADDECPDEFSKIVDRLSERKVKLLTLVHEAGALNQDLRRLQGRFTQARRKAVHNTRVEVLISKIKDLQLTLARKDEILDLQSKNIGLLNEEILELRLQFAGLQKNFETAQERITDLTKDLAGAALESYQRESRMADKESELMKLKTDLAELRERSGLMQRIIQEKESQNLSQTSASDNAGRIAALETQFSQLKQNYASLEKKVMQRESEVVRLSQEILLRETKIANLKKAFLGQERKVDELLGVVQIYKTKLGDAIKILDGVDMRLDQISDFDRGDARKGLVLQPLASTQEEGEFNQPASSEKILQHLSEVLSQAPHK